jgi:hypothetical protein
VAALEAANYAATLDLLRALSTSKEAKELNKIIATCSKGNKDSMDSKTFSSIKFINYIF